MGVNGPLGAADPVVGVGVGVAVAVATDVELAAAVGVADGAGAGVEASLAPMGMKVGAGPATVERESVAPVLPSIGTNSEGAPERGAATCAVGWRWSIRAKPDVGTGACTPPIEGAARASLAGWPSRAANSPAVGPEASGAECTATAAMGGAEPPTLSRLSDTERY